MFLKPSYSLRQTDSWNEFPVRKLVENQYKHDPSNSIPNSPTYL